VNIFIGYQLPNQSKTEGEKLMRVILNDVYLREGAQVEGAVMTPEDQLRYVQLLLEGGIDSIEIGFPSSSPEQLADCQKIVDLVRKWEGKKPLLSGLAIAMKDSIQAVRDAGCDVCHFYIPTSNELMDAQFRDSKYGNTKEDKQNWIVETAVFMVKFALSLGFQKVEFSPEDAARAGRDFLCRLVEAVIGAGATIVNIPDTTGLRIGNEFGDLIAHIFKTVPNIQQAVVSVHCHNDSDHSTNNALQALLAAKAAGAEKFRIEGTFFGLGERSGMTKHEAVIMNILTRRDVMEDDRFIGMELGFNPMFCYKIVHFIAHALGMSVPRQWVVVGDQNALCSAGTHQSIEIKAGEQGSESPYYSWNPAKFGHEKGVSIVIDQSSGRKALADRLSTLGYQVSAKQLSEIYQQVMKLSESKQGRQVSDKEIVAVVQEIVKEIPNRMLVTHCQAIGGLGTIPMAAVILQVNGEPVQKTAAGDGPYDALMKAVQLAAEYFFPVLLQAKVVLDDWQASAVSKGQETLADVYTRIRLANDGNRIFSGRSTSMDTNQATAQSFANCLSWLLTALENSAK